ANIYPIAKLAINKRNALLTGISPFFLSYRYNLKVLELNLELPKVLLLPA
ncbi:uncharacterized protein BDZ99DRAFT_398144, partial [Mytilinidion resinicola]